MGGTVSLYDVLKARKTGLSPDLYTLLIARQEMSESVITAEPPIYFKSDGTPLSEYQISGDTVQNGTPTPDNPVEVLGVGDRTGNLIDVNVSEAGGISDTGELIANPNAWRSTVYYDIDTTLNYVASKAKQTIRINYYDASKNHISREGITQETYKQLTIPSNARYFKWTLYDNNGIPNIQAAHSIKPMVNIGSTALPYEPYGYKIPIISANTTTNIYLGDVQATRKIKKLVFDGTEDWSRETGKTYYLATTMPLTGYSNAICTHYPIVSSYNALTSTDLTFSVSRRPAVFIHDNRFADWNELKSYLAAQYAAGTPVTVWYALETEETGIVNEPLMKIGDYADTLNNEQAGVQIPTVKGNNELNISTTVIPEVTLKGKIRQLPDSDMNTLLSVMEVM